MKTSIILTVCIVMSGCSVTKPRMDIDIFDQFGIDCSQQQEQRAFIDSMRTTPNERGLAVFHLNLPQEAMAAATGKQSSDRLAISRKYDFIADALTRQLDACPNALPRRDGVTTLRTR